MRFLLVDPYITRLGLASLICLPFYIVLRIFYMRLRKGPRNAAREIVMALFILFVAGLFALVFQPGPGYSAAGIGINAARERLSTGAGITLRPFETIQRFLGRGSPYQILVNIVGNVCMFVPIGFCLPLLWQRWQRLWKTFFACLFLTFFIETAQLFVGRDTDVDDVILNVLGGVLGYLLYKLLVLAIPPLKKLGRPGRGKKRKNKTRRGM